MPGKKCTGGATNNAAKTRNSKAYCEGLMHRAEDTALNRPITDNPHASGSEAADAWDLGWTLGDDNAGGTVDRSEAGCCATTGAILV